MNRYITEKEKIYRRVRDAIKEFPSHIIASLRVSMCTPSVIDHLRKHIKKEVGIIYISYENYQYFFWYGEPELNELIRQII